MKIKLLLCIVAIFLVLPGCAGNESAINTGHTISEDSISPADSKPTETMTCISSAIVTENPAPTVTMPTIDNTGISDSRATLTDDIDSQPKEPPLTKGDDISDDISSAMSNEPENTINEEQKTGARGNGNSVDRDTIECKVLGAEDYLGIPDSVKEQFVDFIATSDWFAANCIDIPYDTEWSFESDENGDTLLRVKVWDTDTLSKDNSADYLINTLVFDGEQVVDGLRSAAP